MTAPSAEQLRAVRDWLVLHGNSKCALCGTQWARSISEQNVAFVLVPGQEVSLNLLRWGGPDTRTSQQGPERRLQTLGQRLSAFYRGSKRAVSITCGECGNIILLDRERTDISD